MQKSRRTNMQSSMDYEHSDSSRKYETPSEQTLSIQTFEFPHTLSYDKKAVYMVKYKENLLQPMSSKSSFNAKERGYDFTSSTNSNFEKGPFSIPEKKVRNKCPSSSPKEQMSKASRSSSFSRTQSQDPLVTSEAMIDSHHYFSEKPKHFKGNEWRRPCDESFVAGVPRKFIGSCPPNIEKISKMSKTRQKFFLTQDPRKTHCLVNPELLRRSKKYTVAEEFNTLTKMVKYGQNTYSADAATSKSAEEEESFICEVIDLENPFQLDFQGLDYKNTYQKDEQDQQNQRNYRRLERFVERRKVRAETKTKVDEEMHQERLQVPKGYRVRDRNTPSEPTTTPRKVKLGQLFRSTDKMINREIINMEKERRQERYKNLYLANKSRQDRQKETIKKQQKEYKENEGLISAEIDFQKISNKIGEIVEGTLKKQSIVRQERPHPQDYISNHSRQETGQSEKLGKKETSKASDQNPINAVNMKVGKEGQTFKLRGKISSPPTSKEENIISRNQWLNELVPKREKIKLDVPTGLQKLLSPDDPKLKLFNQNVGYQPPQQECSAVREYRQKPLGRHYERVLRKRIKFIRPRLRYNVKKFNLVGYRFGDTAKTVNFTKNDLVVKKAISLENIADYIQNKTLEKQRRIEEIKEKRLKLLGIACKPFKKSSLQSKFENSTTSSDSEWIPQKDSDVVSAENVEILNFRTNLKDRIPLSRRNNMPAPKYREPTLRQHPRRQRDFENDRVPSEIFDQVVRNTPIPYMYKLAEDIKVCSNAAVKKRRPYTDMFETRHHHDHWNPTQEKYVDVHYQPILVKPEITKVKTKLRQREGKREEFKMANPPGKKYVHLNLTLPEWNMYELMEDYRNATKKVEENTMGTIKIENLCRQKDLIQRSRDPEELQGLDYPGRAEYLEFLHEIKAAIEESKLTDVSKNNLKVNKTQLLQGLQEDLRSIESCLTSLSSSQCTNLSNDSGSYFLMEGKEKIPLDFIRKSLVPFEELQRSRFRAEPIDVDREERNPFRVLPFSGQMKAQRDLSKPQERFFTFNSRLKNGLRLRLEVPTDNVKGAMVGKAGNKYSNLVATDIDENYVRQFKDRSPVKMFNFKTCTTRIKDALRLKFESIVMQGQMDRLKIYDDLNADHWENMQKLKSLYEKLFDKWEKSEYDASMAVAYKVKDIYDETDRLKTELKHLEREQVAINMDIVFTEGHWVRCIMLQNFHYLLGDQEWRIRNDWIHRLPNEDGAAAAVEEEHEDAVGLIKLENFEDSITKRSKINIRQREKDDAWAIKTFYEEVYLQNLHPNLIVFPNANSFLHGLENLKAKTFVLLLEMHFTLAIHTELQGKLETFLEWCAQDLQEKQEYVARKCSKLYFMEDRSDWLRHRTLVYIDKPIEQSFNDGLFLKDQAMVAEAWRRIVPANMRGGGSGEQLQSVEMVAMISDVVMEVIAKFESIPMEESIVIENALRKYRNHLRKISQTACHVERRIEQEMKKVVRNLEPPYRKLKRTTKLPRYQIKKRPKAVQIEEKKISERAKFFFQAFHEDDANIMQTSDIRDSIAQVATIQEQIVPFYFDHFLKLNGYTPNYNFKTQVEMRDGPELDRIKVRSVIPQLQERMLQWEAMKRKIMEDHITQNPKMYINVV